MMREVLPGLMLRILLPAALLTNTSVLAACSGNLAV